MLLFFAECETGLSPCASNRQCVDNRELCDTVANCEDSSDELNCPQEFLAMSITTNALLSNTSSLDVGTAEIQTSDVTSFTQRLLTIHGGTFGFFNYEDEIVPARYFQLPLIEFKILLLL